MALPTESASASAPTGRHSCGLARPTLPRDWLPVMPPLRLLYTRSEIALGEPEYTVTETLSLDGRTRLLRAVRQPDHIPVILKELEAGRSRASDVERLRHEYELGTSLDLPATVRPLALERHQGMPALVYEDFGGIPLDHLLSGPMALQEFLGWAIGIARALEDLQRRGVVHKDLKPQNILIHPVTHEVKLADLGLASRMSSEQRSARPPELIEGSLPYMSPEQTGWMNRALDSRTDLYSLGVTFFQMLTGRLPFTARDPLEWVHAHLARAPLPPKHFTPEVPEALSQIVLKLLSKTAEDRYQTARGLLHDLRRCLDEWTTRGRIEPFPLGQRDVPERFQIPQKLYGRERERAALVEILERVSRTGAPELVLVSGDSGMGKSSLVNELQRPTAESRGLFISGAFDLQRRDIPYSSIVHALSRLVRGLMAESEDRLAEWRATLRTALGPSGGLITALLPELELLVGSQPSAPPLPIDEAKRRFHSVFRRFLAVFARPEAPLVWFLDDLQWADPASLELLTEIVTSPETRWLLTVGTYADNEVDPAHPLASTLTALRASGVRMHELVLGPLARHELSGLVADALRRPREDVAPLVRLIDEKTRGNPFFAIQLLSSLHEDGIIRLDRKHLVWRYDLSAARARGDTDNVVDLMVRKLARLPEPAREAVKLATFCIDTGIDVRTVAALRGGSEEECRDRLRQLVDEGLLVCSGGAYRFLHGRVRQAAYPLVPAEKRDWIHLTAGRLLLARTPPEAVGEKVFEIVSHLNQAAHLVVDPDERRTLAELNLQAGRKAKASAAYVSAVRHLTAGLAVLPPDTRCPLAYSLNLERAECELLARDLGAAEESLRLALSHARTRAEKANVYRVSLELYAVLGETEKGVARLLECAALFDIALERHPAPETVKQQYAAVSSALGNRSVEQLLELPPGDAETGALVAALVAAIPSTLQYDARLSFAVASEAVRLSLQRGNTAASGPAYGLFGLGLCSHLGQSREGHRFAKVGHALTRNDPASPQGAFSGYAYAYATGLWVHPLGWVVPKVEEGLRTASAGGSLTYACWNGSTLVTVLLVRGDPLVEVERRAASILDLVRLATCEHLDDMLRLQRRFIRRLRGGAADVAEEEGLDEQLQKFPPRVWWYFTWTLQERFLFGDHPGALLAGFRARAAFEPVSHWERCDLSFFFALALAAGYADASAEDRPEHLRMLHEEAERIKSWAGDCPESFASRHALVAAEVARIEGRVLDAEREYERAIHSARENGLVPSEAIAYERAAGFYRERGLGLFANACLREARGCYLRWGAEGKVRQLDRLYPELFEPRNLPATAALATETEQLNLLSVFKAAQSISGAIHFDELVSALFETALEQGGAQRGCLLLTRGDQLYVEAEASVGERGVTTRLLGASPLAFPSTLVPASLIREAQRTRAPVILDDASSQKGALSFDAYLVRQKPRSVLCLPILRQADLLGVLYLENNLVTYAFTAPRLTGLTLLASQVAISVENARLLAHEREARAAAEESERRSAFLAEAGALLSQSLGYEETMTRLARLCVQSMADWCAIHVVEGRRIRRVVWAHRDPGRERLVGRLRDYQWDSLAPPAQVLRSGKPILISEVPEEEVTRLSESDDRARIILALGTRSILCVPLIARGRPFAVLAMASGIPGRFQRDDLSLATELAHRAEIAIDNARLFGEAQQSIRLRDEFLSVASHELRTPVTSLQLAVESLERVQQSGATRLSPQLIALATRQSQRLAALVTQLLDVVRIQSGQFMLEDLQDYDLAADLRQVLARHEVKIAQARASVNLHGEASIVGRWDRTRMAQLVTNLLSNALIYGAGRPIDIRLERAEPGSRVRLTVEDQGPGIDPERLPHVFERFERGSSTRHYGGLGLGLFIARAIVRAHRGTITVSSELGRGASFTVDLPLWTPEPHPST